MDCVVRPERMLEAETTGGIHSPVHVYYSYKCFIINNWIEI